MFHVDTMASQLTGGGWRPNHFQVIITNPFDAAADLKVPFMVRAASIPGFTLGKIEVPYFGRRINVPGDRIVEDWNTTVINDTDFIVRNAIEAWHNQMNAFSSNFAQAGPDPNVYKSEAIVRAMDRSKNVIREYLLKGVFPYMISPLETDWGANDTIAEFQVTWAVDSVEILGGTTGNAGGNF